MICPALGFELSCLPTCRLCEGPTSPSLHAEVRAAPEGRLKSCVRCGQGFSPRSNRQRFCDPCAVKNERTKNAEYQANFRKRKEDR